jgi:hypothetical protein
VSGSRKNTSIWTQERSNRKLRKLHSEERQNSYSLSSIIRVINSRKVGWERHVARVGELRIDTHF